MRRHPRSVVTLLVLLSIATVPRVATTLASSLPSGEVMLGQSILEPAYNDLTGSLTYLLTPKAPENTNSHGVSPLYVIVYPTSVSNAIGTVNCAHQPADNCPDHGPGIAGLAMAQEPAVYGTGVWGHDHLVDAPPAPRGDFNVAWLPIAVLFTNSAAAAQHITTEDQLAAAVAAHNVIEIPLPPATFQCATVSASVYGRGTPVPPAPPLP